MAAAHRYETGFYAEQRAGSRRSADAVLPFIADLLQPRSVVDIGCGVGTWLASWGTLGTQDVLGIDGDYVEQSSLEIPASHFRSVDIASPFDLGRTFDFAMCLEVAEHLSRDRADGLIADLVRHADTVLFSAAIPGQTGEHHVNLESQSVWAGRFESLGFLTYDIVRPRIWCNDAVDWWYRQNMLLFARAGSKTSAILTQRTCVTTAPLDVVHPMALRVLADPGGVKAAVRNLRRASLVAAKRIIPGNASCRY